MIDAIQRRLKTIESDHSVRVLFAVESGSRAWGFASKDSDWDVRFVYVRRLDDYLNIHPGRDVIEINEHPLDFAGWDLPKALRLFQKSNPSFMEWLDSPITYCRNESFFQEIQRLTPLVVSLHAGAHHYASMAHTNYSAYFRGPEVSLKKYLYVIRPILAARFIQANHAWPPTLFQSLLEAVSLPKGAEQELADLLEKKRHALEAGLGPRLPELDAYIEEFFAAFEPPALSEQYPDQTDALNKLFRKFVMEGSTPA